MLILSREEESGIKEQVFTNLLVDTIQDELSIEGESVQNNSQKLFMEIAA